MSGQYTDAETGFVYLRARYYDPATGQFLSRDPITALTRQPYSYVGGNPLNFRDPRGLFGWDDVENAAGDAWDATSGAVSTAASATGEFVQDHASEIVAGVVLVTAVGCIVATEGACGFVVGEYLFYGAAGVVTAGGAATLAYGLYAGYETLTGNASPCNPPQPIDRIGTTGLGLTGIGQDGLPDPRAGQGQLPPQPFFPVPF